jgi:hypothetical protein
MVAYFCVPSHHK